MASADPLLQAGIAALKQNQIQTAIQSLEHYCQLDPDELSVYRLQAQMYLVRAYQRSGRRSAAIALCRQLTSSEQAQVSTWARQTLPRLLPLPTPPPAPVPTAPASAPPTHPEQPAGAMLGVVGASGTMPQQQPPLSPAAPPDAPEIQLKSATTFKRHYEQELLDQLRDLDRDRKRLLRQGLITLPLWGLLILLLPFVTPLSVVGMVLLSIYLTVLYQTYRKTFKEKVIVRILRFIDPAGHLTYAHYPANHGSLDGGVRQVLSALNEFGTQPLAPPSQRNLFSDVAQAVQPAIAQLSQFPLFKSIIAPYTFSSRTLQQSRRSFTNSHLFPNELYGLAVEDCVEGQWGETDLYFAEVAAVEKIEDEGLKIRLSGLSEYSTYFCGLFFQANFNKSFQGRTIVVPDVAEKNLGALGRVFQSWNKQHANELIRLEDPEFEQLFAVYGTDQIEARYILSTSLMQRLVDLRQKVGREIRISFVDNHVFIAIPSKNRNLFEPRIFRSLLNFKPALEYFETLQMMIGIVEDLKLNRRIWKSL